MNRILLLFSCLMVLGGASNPKIADNVKNLENATVSVESVKKNDIESKKDIKKATKKATNKESNTTQSQSHGVKKGNITIDGSLNYSSQWYVISSAICKNNNIEYLNDNHKAKVTIYDNNFQVKKVIENAVTKEYYQTITDGTPIEIGLLSKQKNEQDTNFFGWYQADTLSWFLPCQYSSIERINEYHILATTRLSENRFNTQIYDWKQKNSLQISSSHDGQTQLIHSYGSYYWIANGDNKYEIYDQNLKWKRTVNYNDNLIYYEDGTVRIKKEELLNKLKIENTPNTMLTMNSLCWPKNDKTMLCNIAPNKECGYQETQDYIINKYYSEVYHQNISGANIHYKNGYYECLSDGDYADRYVYDSIGNQVISKDGIIANGMVKTDEGYNFFGYQDGKIHIFNTTGDLVLSFAMENKNSFFKHIVGRYGDIVLVMDYEKQLYYIYNKDKCIKSDEFKENELEVHMCHRLNGDVLISIGPRFYCINEEGKIRSDETIKGRIVEILEHGYIVSVNGKMMVIKFPCYLEEPLKLAGKFGKTSDHKYYVISDVIVPEYGNIPSKYESIPNVTILDENNNEIRTIPNAIARQYFQEVTGDTPIEIGLFSERENENCPNFFGWYQPENDQWLLPCKYASIDLHGDVIYVYTNQDDNCHIKKIHLINNKDNKCIQLDGRSNQSTVSNYGDFYWFYDGSNKYVIFNKNLKHIRTVLYRNDVFYFEDGTIRVTLDEILKANDLDYKEPIMVADSNVWPSYQKKIICSIFDDNNRHDEADEGSGVVINEDLEIFIRWNGHIDDLSEVDNYYIFHNDLYEDHEVCNKDGKEIVSQTGIRACDLFYTKDGYHFIGKEGNVIVIFNEQGVILDFFEISVTPEMEVCGLYDSILIAYDLDFDLCLKVFYENKQIIKNDFDSICDVFWIQKENGEVVVGIGQRLYIINQHGKILFDQNLDEQILGLFEYGCIVKSNHHVHIIKYEDLINK